MPLDCVHHDNFWLLIPLLCVHCGTLDAYAYAFSLYALWNFLAALCVLLHLLAAYSSSLCALWLFLSTNASCLCAL